MTRPQKLIVGAASALVLYTLLGFFAAPAVLRPVLTSRLTEALHRPVQIRKVSVNPFVLSLTLSGLSVEERSGGVGFFSVGRFYANAQLSSLWKRGLVLSQLQLDQPYVRIARLEGGRYNVSDLLEPSGTKKTRPLRFALGNIRVTGGSVDLVDRVSGNLHTVRDLDVSMPFISNFPAYIETFSKPSLTAKIDGSPFSIQGESKPFAHSLETSVTLGLQGLDVPKALNVVKLPWKARLASARLDLNLHVAYAQYQDRGPTLKLSGDAAVSDLAVDDEGGAPLVRLPRVAVAFGPVEVFSRSVRIARLEVDQPDLHIRRDGQGRWNWEALLPPPAERTAPSDGKASRSLDYLVDEIAVKGGRFAFDDQAVKGSFHTVLSPVDLSVHHLTGRSGELATFSLGVRTESEESLAVEGKVGLAPLASSGTVRLEGLRLKKYAPYYAGRYLLATAAGTLGVSTGYQFERKESGPSLRLEDLGAKLASVEVRATGAKEPFLRLPELTVGKTAVDLDARTVTVGSFSTRGARLSVRRTAAGLDLQKLIPPSPPQAAPPGEAAGEQKPWAFTLATGSVRDYEMRLDDETPATPARLTISRLSLEGSNLSTVPGTKGRLRVSATINRSGSISLRGPVTVKPLSADLDASLKTLALAPFQPYFADRVRVLVTSGTVSSSGKVGLRTEKDGKTVGSFRGGLQLASFQATDKSGTQDLLRFSSLSVEGIEARQVPETLRIQGIALTDFSGSVTVGADGSVNVSDLFVSAPKPEKTAAPPAEPTPEAKPPEARPDIQIPTVTLQGGTLHFHDRHVKPEFSAELTEIGGRVSGLSSAESTLADVDLRGKFNGYAPLRITGKINPLRQDLYVDLKASFEGADLTPATPYTTRYVGYTVEKGKLSLDVTYRILKTQLDAQNVIVLDQFYLGDRVESPGASSLPIKLGLALLRDRQGKIRLDIPVEGNLSSPDFHLGGVIWQAIVGLITKAVTAPFSFLGSLFGGGGEQLGYVDFAAGSAAISADQAKKIATLGKALHDRPQLQLDIMGHADPEADRAALADRFFLRKLKAQKAKELLKEGQSPGSVDSLTISPQEYDKYLALAYHAEPFPKPTNPGGGEKVLPAPEMEKLLRSQVRVTDDDLRALAAQRAGAVREALIATGSVTPARIFGVDSELAPEGGKEPGTRVDFKLK